MDDGERLKATADAGLLPMIITVSLKVICTVTLTDRIVDTAISYYCTIAKRRDKLM